VHLVDQVLAEGDAALPEVPGALADERMMENVAREHRAQREHAERHQHRQRAFVRVIAGSAVVMLGVAMIAMTVVVIMDSVLDMLRLAQRGLPKKVRNTGARNRSWSAAQR
jgi:hypothetical protein